MLSPLSYFVELFLPVHQQLDLLCHSGWGGGQLHAWQCVFVQQITVTCAQQRACVEILNKGLIWACSYVTSTLFHINQIIWCSVVSFMDGCTLKGPDEFNPPHHAIRCHLRWIANTKWEELKSPRQHCIQEKWPPWLRVNAQIRVRRFVCLGLLLGDTTSFIISLQGLKGRKKNGRLHILFRESSSLRKRAKVGGAFWSTDLSSLVEFCSCRWPPLISGIVCGQVQQSVRALAACLKLSTKATRDTCNLSPL